MTVMTELFTNAPLLDDDVTYGSMMDGWMEWPMKP